MVNLSSRLQLIFSLLKPDLSVWDVCCDHGYIGLRAYESQGFCEINFVDQVPEIMQRLKKHFTDNHWHPSNTTSVQFHSMAAEQITNEITGNLIMAGIGSYTIARVLTSLTHRQLLQAHRIIICPQNEVVSIDKIKNILGAPYSLFEITTVIEKNRKRKIYVFDKTSNLRI